MRSLVKSVSAIGLCLYGIAWVFIAAALEPLKVSPSDIGIDFAFLVSRVGAVAVLVGCILVIPLHATDAWHWRERGQGGDLRWFNRLFLLAHGGFCVLLWLCVFGWVVGFRASLSAVAFGGLIALGCVGVTLSLCAWSLTALGFTARASTGPQLVRCDRPSAKLVVAAAYILLALVTTGVLGHGYGSQLRNGHPPDLRLLRFPNVEVEYLDEIGHRTHLDLCTTLLLGYSGDRVFVYDSLQHEVLSLYSSLLVTRASATNSTCQQA